MNKTKFFRRRQFILSPEDYYYEGWKKYTVAERYCLSVHPDLSVSQVRHETKSITLLGNLIDPEKIGQSQTLILNDICKKASNLIQIINSFEIMSGRFVAVIEMQNHIHVFNDACGLMQVVYCTDNKGKMWCASQAESLAEQLKFHVDEEVIEFINSPIIPVNKSELWMPNNRTYYKEILHLLPNHYLDFDSGRSLRFWPTKDCICPISVKEGVQIASSILKNSIHEACNRFDLKMSISAGIDSRMTLAATKEVKQKITYFTHAPGIENNRENQRILAPNIPLVDVKVPAQLLSRLDIPHLVLKQKVMDDVFRKYYESSATFARETKGHNAYNVFHYLGSEVNVLNSNTAETTQCKYWLPKSHINGEGLAIATGLYHPMAFREFDNWIKGAKDACESSGLNMLSLFHWEQRAGRWVAASFCEYDIAHDSFTPYNNRYLNKILLGISERYRRNGIWYISLEIIKSLWPDVLSAPVNPPETLSDKILYFLRRQILHKYITPWIPIYEYAKYLQQKMKAKARVRHL